MNKGFSRYGEVKGLENSIVQSKVLLELLCDFKKLYKQVQDLGGKIPDIDFSIYELKENKSNSLSHPNSKTYPTTQAVVTALQDYVKIIDLPDPVDISGKEDTANKATDFSIIDDIKYPTVKAVDDALAQITDVIVKSLTEVKQLILDKELVAGRYYKITGCQPEIYNDGRGLGTEIILKALSDDTLSEEGYGKFYTPNYSEFYHFENKLSFTLSSTTGEFNDFEVVNIDGGGTAKLWFTIQSKILTNYNASSFTPNGSATITGSVSGATASITGISIPTGIGYKEWGGFIWEGIKEFSDDLVVDEFNLSSGNWSKVTYDTIIDSTPAYIESIERVKYNINDDIIYARKDNNNNNYEIDLEFTKTDTDTFPVGFMKNTGLSMFPFNRPGVSDNNIKSSQVFLISARVKFIENDIDRGSVISIKSVGGIPSTYNDAKSTDGHYIWFQRNKLDRFIFRNNIFYGGMANVPSFFILNSCKRGSNFSSSATSVTEKPTITGNKVLGWNILSNYFSGRSQIVNNSFKSDNSSGSAVGTITDIEFGQAGRITNCIFKGINGGTLITRGVLKNYAIINNSTFSSGGSLSDFHIEGYSYIENIVTGTTGGIKHLRMFGGSIRGITTSSFISDIEIHYDANNVSLVRYMLDNITIGKNNNFIIRNIVLRGGSIIKNLNLGTYGLSNIRSDKGETWDFNGVTISNSISQKNQWDSSTSFLAATPLPMRKEGMLTEIYNSVTDDVELWFFSGGVADVNFIKKDYEDVSNKVQDLSSPSSDTYLSTAGLNTILSDYTKNVDLLNEYNFQIFLNTPTPTGWLATDEDVITNIETNWGGKVKRIKREFPFIYLNIEYDLLTGLNLKEAFMDNTDIVGVICDVSISAIDKMFYGSTINVWINTRGVNFSINDTWYKTFETIEPPVGQYTTLEIIDYGLSITGNDKWEHIFGDLSNSNKEIYIVAANVSSGVIDSKPAQVIEVMNQYADPKEINTIKKLFDKIPTPKYNFYIELNTGTPTGWLSSEENVIEQIENNWNAKVLDIDYTVDYYTTKINLLLEETNLTLGNQGIDISGSFKNNQEIWEVACNIYINSAYEAFMNSSIVRFSNLYAPGDTWTNTDFYNAFVNTPELLLVYSRELYFYAEADWDDVFGDNHSPLGNIYAGYINPDFVEDTTTKFQIGSSLLQDPNDFKKKEDKSNKAIDFTVLDDKKYPTTKAVNTLLDSILESYVNTTEEQTINPRKIFKSLNLDPITRVQRDLLTELKSGDAIFQSDEVPGLYVYDGTNWLLCTPETYDIYAESETTALDLYNASFTSGVLEDTDGIVGEKRYMAEYVYECVEQNKWVRWEIG